MTSYVMTSYVITSYVMRSYEHKCHDPGHRFFLSRKFDLISLLPRLGHSSLLNVSCAQILPRLGHSSLLNVSCAQILPRLGHSLLLNVSCAQILHKLSNTAQMSNMAQTEQHGKQTRGAKNARFTEQWRLRSYCQLIKLFSPHRANQPTRVIPF